jgi:HprK-related kinase A
MTAAPTSLPRARDLAPAEFARRLRGAGLVLRVGPFDITIQARASALAGGLMQRLYADYPVVNGALESSFHVRLAERRRWLPRRWREVRFMVDGRAPHPDLPAGQALAVLEWGINLVVALRYHCFLMLHAAVVERNGFALVLPAAPGSGKTTLCAALVHRGWRLLSDEFGILRPGTIDFIPLPRLMPLKNDAIEVMARFAPQAEWGPRIEGTRKGTIRHLRPPTASVDRAADHVPARWLVFPRWSADARLRLEPITASEAFMQIATNAFNYEMQGHAGFTTVRSLVSSASAHFLDYARLDDAVAALNELADGCAR